MVKQDELFCIAFSGELGRDFDGRVSKALGWVQGIGVGFVGVHRVVDQDVGVLCKVYETSVAHDVSFGVGSENDRATVVDYFVDVDTALGVVQAAQAVNFAQNVFGRWAIFAGRWAEYRSGRVFEEIDDVCVADVMKMLFGTHFMNFYRVIGRANQCFDAVLER